MELDVEDNPARQVSQFFNHDKLWECEEVQVNKVGFTKYQCPCNCHGSKVLLQSTITYENLAMMTSSLILYW
jgi:hypothetical protein